MRLETPYNPLDKRNLGVSVADALLARPAEPLPPSEPFFGAGIYAIYYMGDYPPYRPISALNSDGKLHQPIYVGKAVPTGARKGNFGLDVPAGTALHGRLREHSESVRLARNLDLSDFQCRYLVVDDIWIPLGESLLIQRYAPAWNLVLDGFGNHDPGGGRYNQQKSPWDVLHPGRAWAEKLQPPKRSEEDLLSILASFLSGSRVTTVEMAEQPEDDQ